MHPKIVQYRYHTSCAREIQNYGLIFGGSYHNIRVSLLAAYRASFPGSVQILSWLVWWVAGELAIVPTGYGYSPMRSSSIRSSEFGQLRLYCSTCMQSLRVIIYDGVKPKAIISG